jgi:hypothetical protein
MTTFRGARRYRSPYGRSSSAGKVAGLALGTALAASAGAHAVTSAHAKAHPAHVTAVTGGSEAAFMAAVLSGLGAPASAANVGSLEAWVRHETPWPPVAANNPMNTTLQMAGSWAYNYLPGGGSVQNYPTASEGAQATALTLGNGWYPAIVSALRSGAGLCGNPALAGELGKWSGNGYAEVC